jgi:hypothetical protein
MFVGITLSLLGRLRSGGALSAYAVLNYEPQLVFDFDSEFYRKSGEESTFSDSITHSASSNATMVDSDGLLKWRPHNLFNYSDGSQAQLLGTDTTDAATPIEGFSNSLYFDGDGTLSLKYWGGIPGGVLLTISVYVELDSGAEPAFPSQPGAPFAFVVGGVSPSYVSGYNVVHVSGNVYQVSTTMISGFSGSAGIIQHTNQIIPFKATRWQCYRSDLGGMVNNPDRGDSYVPTTSQKVYLPRRGHHVYNGDSWVNKGLLHESEQRVNLVPYSNDFTQWTIWNTDSVTLTSNSLSQSGLSLSRVEITDTTSETHGLYRTSDSINPSVLTCHSAFLKADQQRYVAFRSYLGTGPDWYVVVFDLQEGVVTQETASGNTTIASSGMEDFGNGLYRCYVVFSDSVRTSVAAHSIMFVDGPTPAINATNGEYAYSGTAGDGLYVGGVVIEQGSGGTAASTPSSYMPTNGSQFTRSAETLTVPAANLPWPSPVVIGEELFSDFATESEWVDNGDGSWTITNATGNSDLRIDNLTTIGKHYQYTFDITTTSSLVVYTNQSSPVFRATGSYTVNNVATSSFFIFRATAGTTATVSNISVKEINPLSVSIQMQGEMTYADGGNVSEVAPYLWINGNDFIWPQVYTITDPDRFRFLQSANSVVDFVQVVGPYAPGVNVPFNIASRHGSTFINGAVDGQAMTADLTPTALPDLSATDLQLGYDFMGTISLFRVWADDLTDAGIAEASAPSTVPSLSLTFDGASTSFTDSGMVV